MRGEFFVALSDTSNVKFRYGPPRGSPKTTPRIFDAVSTVVTDALYEAGFEDALVGMAGGVPYIDVNHRQAESLEKAVREAIRDVEKAGFHVVRVESEIANAITRINADLLTLSSHS